MHAPAEQDGLVLRRRRVEFLDVRPDLSRASLGLDEGRVAVLVRERVGSALLGELARGDLGGLLSLERSLLSLLRGLCFG